MYIFVNIFDLFRKKSAVPEDRALYFIEARLFAWIFLAYSAHFSMMHKMSFGMGKNTKRVGFPEVKSWGRDEKSIRKNPPFVSLRAELLGGLFNSLRLWVTPREFPGCR